MQHITSPGDLGKIIREARKSQELTQLDLADVAGVGITFVSQLERGKVTVELGRTIKVLTALGIDLYTEVRL
ncbi:type II toxin-antitoxin system Y4mF family antitoxin [Lancefieldella rimae]|uniref:Helix-turn-helix transcriptional regulator n=1 Tax=Lancefieldella rimae TaxID=1383 RepID=A0A930YRR6_9ACTN|nr:type II toxin-antitoxin system Y4mF family antitoxin [Lancefieldella rimae]MBF4807141.1 helix-turn-helix transcriptional regulator [Lancefieldella rimae]